MTLFAEYTDPRIVALYDTVCPLGADSAFYLGLARELRASTVIDIGCGTGILTCELARAGHRLIGVDPAPAMLAVARTRPDGERVRWIDGDASRLGNEQADLVIMTSHVAQVITDDDEWHATLAAAHRALRGGGHLAFESRDPRAQVWAAGEIYAAVRHFDDAANGPFDMWQEVIDVVEGRVLYELRYRFPDGVELVSQNELRFRTQAELTDALVDAGFAVERVFGDWDRAPVGDGTPELIFVARR